MLRLQGILRAVINVTLTTLSIHSRSSFRCSHFHVGTKTQKNLAPHMWEQKAKACKSYRKTLCFTHFPSQAQEGGIQQREKLIWHGLTHSGTVTHARGSHSPARLETRPPADCPIGSRELLKACSWQGCSALECTLHHTSSRENWIS